MCCWLLSFLFSGCYEQGYAGNITVYGICVRSIYVWTRCSASHIQIGPRLACLNLLAMQPSTPISAYHHIKIIHTRINTHDYIVKIQYTYTAEFLYSKVIRSRAFPLIFHSVCNLILKRASKLELLWKFYLLFISYCISMLNNLSCNT